MKKILFTVTGPSGVGKSSLFAGAMGTDLLITSFTTRKIRDNEVNGVDYHFITQEQMEQMDKEGLLFEKETHYGNTYGITQEEFENKIQNDCYFVTNAGGLNQIRQKYDRIVSYLIVSTPEDVEKQLRERGGDEADIELRLSQYQKDVEEMKTAATYDVIFYNEYGKYEEMVKKLKVEIADWIFLK